MATKLSKKQCLEFYETMFRMRRFEEEVFEFYKKGLMPGLAHLYLGEEAVATGCCAALKKDDYIGSSHRGHGHLVARGAKIDMMMAEILGKETGYSHGKGGSMHIMALDKGILGASHCSQSKPTRRQSMSSQHRRGLFGDYSLTRATAFPSLCRLQSSAAGRAGTLRRLRQRSSG